MCARLEHWFKPYREQPGAQRGRGCIEYIVTLRLLTDVARRRKKLFVTLIDFSKAYDLVPRHIPVRILMRRGCGMVMLGIICAIMYSVIESIISTNKFVTTVGVRQGSPTSCLLFIIVHVNDLIKLIKDNCINEGFLKWLHIVILMDDIVLLSPSRERIIRKLSLVKKFCCEYGMTVNESKTKLCDKRYGCGQRSGTHRWTGGGVVCSVHVPAWVGHPSLLMGLCLRRSELTPLLRLLMLQSSYPFKKKIFISLFA